MNTGIKSIINRTSISPQFTHNVFILSLYFHLFILFIYLCKMSLSKYHIIQLVFILSVRSWSLHQFFKQKQHLHNTTENTNYPILPAYWSYNSSKHLLFVYLFMYFCSPLSRGIMPLWCHLSWPLQHLQQHFDMGGWALGQCGGSMQLGWTVAFVCVRVWVCVPNSAVEPRRQKEEERNTLLSHGLALALQCKAIIRSWQ